MITRTLLTRSAIGALIALSLVVGGACGNRSDDSSSADDSTTSTTAEPAASSSTEEDDSQTSAASDELSIFCTNAKPIGFTDLTDIQPLDPTSARELRAKLNLIEASAPDDIIDTLLTIRATTNPYLDAVESGEITDNNTVITWASTFDIPTIEKTVEAVPVMGAYVTEHC